MNEKPKFPPYASYESDIRKYLEKGFGLNDSCRKVGWDAQALGDGRVGPSPDDHRKWWENLKRDYLRRLSKQELKNHGNCTLTLEQDRILLGKVLAAEEANEGWRH
jgi:hypothetical protein